MNTTTPRPSLPLEDVLYEFSLEKEVPDAELLDEFVRRYPEHAQALTDFAVELAVDSLRPRGEEVIADSSEVSPAVSRAMSSFHNALHSLQARKPAERAREAAQTATIENPFMKYNQAGFRQLARDLKVNSLFACKLRDREIDPSTMTDGFRRFVSETMAVPADLLAAHFMGPTPTIPRAQFHKAEQKPEAGRQQSFEEAVRSSGLTEEQQRFLLSL